MGFLAKAQVYNEHQKYDEVIKTFTLALKKTIEKCKKIDIHLKFVS